MKNTVLTILALSMILFTAGCGSTKIQETKLGKAPGWYDDIHKDNDYIFAANTQRSRDLQLALDKATAAGRAEIARKVAVQVKSIQKRFIDEVGNGMDSKTGDLFSQVEKNIASECLAGSVVTKQNIVKEGEFFRAYVLVSYPVGKANAEFLESIKSREYSLTRMRATKAFAELERDVERYEQLKKAQKEDDALSRSNPETSDESTAIEKNGVKEG
ncbi:hypothetical protein [Pelodictyon luteolum]|uniref:Lipoprotein n=1 Tax=Chlorobium luteolum (strain DSM 273 / BCRC 81028 / 2530) TaxID=319225 RepID=Q3B5Q6_CHLL3|nr:hypothetical protein [Pelodictyon luteolum]ABB23325.1 hypothetical protein Plut_0437 [Pelodictyon luteolum DSM 273]